MKLSSIYTSLPGIILVLSPVMTSHAETPYVEENRIEYLTKVLQAFDDTPVSKIVNSYRYMSIIESNNCRSSLSDLKIECMLSHARSSCNEIKSSREKLNCELYSDIIITNKLSEKTFVSKAERYRMLKNTSDNFTTVMANRLQQKYSRIITTFYLEKGATCADNDFSCLARNIDQFCLDYSNIHSLSWQYCVSASVWFIGTSKK